MSDGGALATVRETSEIVLEPDRDAPRAAREFVADVLRRWRVHGPVEPAELVVSELVTNAVRHAGTTVTLRLIPTVAGLLVEVDDAARAAPRMVPVQRRAIGGHGLAIIDRLAVAWGHRDREGGKTVWAELLFPDEVSHPASDSVGGTAGTDSTAGTGKAAADDDDQ